MTEFSGWHQRQRLVEPNPIEEMEEDTVVSLKFDKEKLYKNMVDAKADWLYELPSGTLSFPKKDRKSCIWSRNPAQS